MTKQNNNNIGLMLNQIMDYVFKDKPNPYVLFDALVNFVDLIAAEIGGSSYSGKYKDVSIRLINDAPNLSLVYKDFLNPEIQTTVSTDIIIYIPVLNAPSGKTCIPINYCFSEFKSTLLPKCEGDIEYDSTRGLFFITGNGTIVFNS